MFSPNFLSVFSISKRSKNYKELACTPTLLKQSQIHALREIPKNRFFPEKIFPDSIDYFRLSKLKSAPAKKTDNKTEILNMYRAFSRPLSVSASNNTTIINRLKRTIRMERMSKMILISFFISWSPVCFFKKKRILALLPSPKHHSSNCIIGASVWVKDFTRPYTRLSSSMPGK